METKQHLTKIGLASDHAGLKMKEHIRTYLNTKNIPSIDYGTYSTESASYALYGHKLAEAVETGEVQKGIAVCGSGNGVNMALNKHRNIRSALCWNEEIARLAREHNDANVLALPGRFLAPDLAERIVDTFLTAHFEGGRHQERVEAIEME
ncbi:MAG: ribose 5-phosphate isomerase B [Dysgonamonadaceae bacterium]|jgi:ribose 5-phosphate isomerase B|nr:ribose 5-phosphate isomerase B [Dysgonamonadaceae bacterium]